MLERKNDKLKNLKNIIITNYDLSEDGKLDLDTLLDNQDKVTKDSNNKRFDRNLSNSKRNLIDSKVTKSEINNLCQLQQEVTELEIELGKITKVINNVYNNIIGIQAGGDVNVKDFIVEGATINYEE